MATVIGQSGAWRRIVGDLAQRGHTVSIPQELHPLLAELEDTRPKKMDARREQTARAVQDRATRMDALAVERRFFRRFLNWFRIRGLKTEIAALYKADSNYSSALDETITHVRSLLESVELAGANAELAVIECLRALPSSAIVFNDIQLRATRFIQFEGKALMSAQIDHVVLTPAGVFVIETKYWSPRFVESGNFFDPFEQVSRASYLCYDLLRETFGKTRVRSIIACFGKLPEAPRGSYIKVVRPESLTTFISGFRSVELSASRLSELRSFFEHQLDSRSSAA